jgi:hypothetical protein
MGNTPKIVGAGHSPEDYMRMQLGKITGQRKSKLEMAQRKLYKQSMAGIQSIGRKMANRKYGNMYGNVQIANPKTWEDRNRANQGTKLNK